MSKSVQSRITPKLNWLLNLTPRAVQLEANRRSYPRPGYALFLEMRLGKTFALLNEYLLFKRDHNLERLLVISPNKYKYAWKEEIERCGMVESTHVYESSNGDLPAVDIVIANYEALQHEKHYRTLRRFNADMVTFDESILVKNKATLAFKRGLMLADAAKIVRILTGKPIVQGPHDLWSQLRLIRQLDGFNYYAFRNWFCKMGGFMGKQIIGYREDTRPKLQEILSSCSFIASRREWGKELPTDYETRSPEILPIQAVHYKEMEKNFITYMKSGMPVTADQVITKHIKLQQIASGFLIDENKKIHELVDPAELPKLRDLVQSLENEVSHKALVICFYIHSVRTLLEALNEYRPALIAGGELMKSLGRHVEKEKRWFNENPACRVMIAQVQAVKYGHNLAANGECDTIFYYENTYNLDDRSQSEQRPQGEEQKTNLHVIDYASTKVERQIIRALQRKDKISEAILRAYDD